MKKFSLSTWRPTRKTFHTKQSFREFLKLIFLSFSKDLAYDTWKVKAGGITLYHFSGLVFKFNFSFHKIFLSNIGKWTDFTRNWYLGQNFWTKVKISFLAKISNLLKFFRKSACSSDKFPDLAFGPSNYLPNISHRQFSFRIVIKHLIKFCPASGSLRLSEARTVSQLSTRWQPNWSRAQQTSSDRYFPTNVPSLFVAMTDSRRAQEKILDHYNYDHSEITQNAKVSSKASVCSCQVFWPNFLQK